MDEILFLPLGGVGEIGMNCYAYGAGSGRGRQWVLVDLGVKFGEETEPGVDLVLPDISFIESNCQQLTGIVLTHGHEDHLGALPWLWPRLRVPVYCTAFTAVLLKGKLREHGLEGDVPVRIVRAGERIRIGCFDIEYVSVSHSIPESHALIIETRAGRVLHTGDWKIDRTPGPGGEFDEDRLRRLGETGLDALVCDSTNVLRGGFSPSERDVSMTLEKLVGEAKARVAITTFASHVGRISAAVRAARLAGREVVVVGRAMRNTIEAARATGYLADAGTFLEEEAFGYLPPGGVMLLCTGSQGESRAAIARIAEDQHPHVALEEGDLVIFSSKTIPGNERAVNAVFNNLARLGVGVVSSEEALVHTSGHPRKEELRVLYDLTRPRALVPVHGEHRHLGEHAKFASAHGIEEIVLCENGHLVRLVPGPAAVVDEVTAGRCHVDGKIVVSASNGPARQRRKLSFTGIVFVSLVLDDRQQLVGVPAVDSEGLPTLDSDSRPLQEELIQAASNALAEIPRARRKDDDVVAETIRSSVRRAAEQAWGKKPGCKVQIHRLAQARVL